MSDLKQFLPNKTYEILSNIDDDATSSGSATTLPTPEAVDHIIFKLRTSKSTDDTSLYFAMPNGTHLGQTATVIIYEHLYSNHTMIPTNMDTNTGKQNIGNLWQCIWNGTVWKKIY